MIVSPSTAKNSRRRKKCRASMGVLLLDGTAASYDVWGGAAAPRL
jgi:hypothetical protein